LKNYCLPEILNNIGIKYKLILKDLHYNDIISLFSKNIDKSISSGIREYYRILEKLILEINKDILLDNFDLRELMFTEDYKLELTDKCFNFYMEKIKSRILDIDFNENYNHMYI
jgi:hypothetical protein